LSLRTGGSFFTKSVLYVFPCLLSGLDLPFELGVFQGSEDFPEQRSGLVTHFLQIIASQQLGRVNALWWSPFQQTANEFIGIQPPMTRKAIQAVQGHVLAKLGQADKPLQSRGPHALHIFEP